MEHSFCDSVTSYNVHKERKSTKDLSQSILSTKNDRSNTKSSLVLHKLKTIVSGLSSLRKGKKSQQKLHQLSQEKEAATESPSDYFGTFSNMIEAEQCQDLIATIKSALAKVQESELKSEILVPCGLVTKIATEMMLLASSEPCGIRGCMLYINLEEKDKCRTLVKLPCDPQTVSTFELYLTLREETRGWSLLKKLFISFSGRLEKKPKLTEIKLLCPFYNLEKNKLYRAS